MTHHILRDWSGYDQLSLSVLLWPTEGEATMFNPSTVPVTRYRYRGYNIPSRWAATAAGTAA